ncbi:cation-translocating P-type ATPase [Mycolicibacillus parakoreensis]|uniref:Cation-translocating P-type ATPase n=1 Tax=Mycolicibacillus parakoreensis TaxID=1069221 RepID=A0ABY3TXH9_9MYCO|nr:cation-translocating P-type ATPase [Mycolicibacillus parakoreensis]ULN52417.1 cation-translocating P-type ATPase [Mycolicibacillus parakoreensis]
MGISSVPLRLASWGLQTSATLVGASVSATAAATEVATRPARELTTMVSRGVGDVLAGRRSWRGNGRAWIEVRGLRGESGRELGPAVLAAVADAPGVHAAQLNYPLSRLVLTVDDTVALRELGQRVGAVERRYRHTAGRAERAVGLPGDGLVAAARVVTAGANTVGFGVALAGWVMRVPPLPASVEAVVAALSYQPRLRELLEERLGPAGTDTTLAVAMAVAHTVTVAPAALLLDVLSEAVALGEHRAAAEAWRRHEPALARYAGTATAHRGTRAVPAPPGAVARHANLAALVQAVGAAAVGAATRNPQMAATAVLVTAPKAARMTRETFAARLGQELAERHDVLTLAPAALRRLDRVDTLVIDPRVLCTDRLRVTGVRGVPDRDLAGAWARAQERLDGGGLTPGWHSLDPDTALEALYRPAHDPLAAALVTEARRCELEVVSVDIDVLDELRPGFDDVEPSGPGTVDADLASLVTGLQAAGKTVAVLSTAAGAALAAADLSIGVLTDVAPPPFHAELLVTGLPGAWQVLHALPAARTAARRGIEIATGASALGSLLMLPGVRGTGPGPVTSGAAVGLLTGFLLARRTASAPTPAPAPVQEWHAMSAAQVRAALPTPRREPAPAVRFARVQPGLRVLGRAAEVSVGPRRSAAQFGRAVRAELADPMTPILALGSAASAVLGSPVDAIMVGSVLTGNAMLAAAQRLRAETKLNELLAQQAPMARRVDVTDHGEICVEIPAEALLPGDLIEVHPDEVVPADARLIDAPEVEVDESSLTGESMPVDKQTEATPGADLAEQFCMLFAGTTVVTGTARAVVTAVGADTQVRRAADLVGAQNETVGLQHQLGQLTTRAWPVSMGGGAAVGLLGLLRGKGLRQAVADGIAVSVAAVPEGMPLVATLAQQASARRLTGLGALVRVPRSVEALGRVDVVCFDKTGTLSENRLQVTQVRALPGHTEAEVLRCAAAATPTINGRAHVHATDTAIITAAVQTNGESAGAEPVAHLPFRPGRSFSASVCGSELTVKGAPEVLLAGGGRASAAQNGVVDALAADGLRVIAVARRRLSAAQIATAAADPDTLADLGTENLELIGFLGLADTPRPESAQLLADLRDHGLGIRLITGDHPITAAAIARELGMPVRTDQVVSGAQWDAMSRKAQERAVAATVIFARMSPAHKVQIVQTLERIGRVCAMVGDGSNDAAAIRAATVGVGVVGRGSDPAHGAADVVLVDGRIESLVAAIEEGRQLWQRVQSAVAVLLGGNAGEVAFATLGTAIGGTSPLNTRQLLLVNMLTDALPAAALAVSAPRHPISHDVRGPDERRLWRAVAVRGTATAGAATAAWAMASLTGRQQRASTVALVALVSAQLGQTLLDSRAPLVVLTAGGSLAVMGTLISIPGLSQFLGCTPLGPVGWAQALGSASAAVGAAAVLPRALGVFELPPAPPPATAPRTGDAAESSEPQPQAEPSGQPEDRSSHVRG